MVLSKSYYFDVVFFFFIISCLLAVFLGAIVFLFVFCIEVDLVFSVFIVFSVFGFMFVLLLDHGSKISSSSLGMKRFDG